MYCRLHCISILCTLLLLGCGNRERLYAFNAPPVAPSVRISPNPATTTDILIAEVTSVEVDGAPPVVYTYQWFDEGVAIDAPGAFLAPELTQKNRTYQVQVTPNDGVQDGPSASTFITIENSKPSVSGLVIVATTDIDGDNDSSTVVSGDELGCEYVFHDADLDVDASQIEWFINDESVGTEAALVTDLFAGDKVKCKVTPTDTEGAVGEPIEVEIQVLLEACPESFTEHVGDPTRTCIGDYRIDANDTEGDLLTVGHCLTISGDLEIRDVPLTSLVGLEGLNAIGKTLRITENSELVDLSGLGNLTFVGKDVLINGNQRLVGLSGIDRLTCVGRDIEIEDNASLASLEGLGRISIVDSDLIIAGNAVLEDLNGIQSLVAVTETLEVRANPLLADLSSLARLEWVGENLIFENLPSIVDLVGLDSLVSVGRTLRIGKAESAEPGNSLLESVHGLENLETVGGDFLILGNPMMTNLWETVSLSSIGGDLNIVLNSNMNGLDGFNALEELGGSLTVSRNHAMTDIDGFAILETLGGDLELRSNSSLTDFGGLNGITSVGGDLSILDSVLTDLKDLDELTSIGGNLVIGENAYLQRLDELVSLTEVGEGVSIVENSGLTSLHGVGGLEQLSGDFSIVGNPVLRELLSPESVNSIGGTLSIQGNPLLDDFSGMESLVTIGEDFHVTENYNEDSVGVTSAGMFTSLVSVGRNFQIYRSRFHSLDGFSQLASVGRVLQVSENEFLTEVNLPALGGYVYYLDVVGNSVVRDLTGIAGIVEIYGFRVHDNRKLCQTHVDSFLEGIEVVRSTNYSFSNDDC